MNNNDELDGVRARLREELQEALERDRLGMPRGAKLDARITTLRKRLRELRNDVEPNG